MAVYFFDVQMCAHFVMPFSCLCCILKPNAAWDRCRSTRSTGLFRTWRMVTGHTAILSSGPRPWREPHRSLRVCTCLPPLHYLSMKCAKPGQACLLVRMGFCLGIPFPADIGLLIEEADPCQAFSTLQWVLGGGCDRELRV